MNKLPWNLILGSVLVLAILVGLAQIVGLWLLIALPAWVAYAQLERRLRRRSQLAQRGYFSGRRERDKWVYEELQNGVAVPLVLKVENTEPGHWELFFPNEQEWRQSAPEWAANRRAEIARRISEGWKPRDFHLPGDLNEA